MLVQHQLGNRAEASQNSFHLSLQRLVSSSKKAACKSKEIARARKACKGKCKADSSQPAKAASSRASNGFRARKACKGKCTADSSQPAKAANSRASNGFRDYPSWGEENVSNSGAIINAIRNLELNPSSNF